MDSVGDVALRVNKQKSATPMSVEKLDGTTALNLNGRWFMGKLSDIKEFKPEKTFSTTIVFSLSELPEGVNGYSLLQFSNMRSGYRLFITSPKHGRQLSLIYYAVPDAKHTAVKGKTKLELNKFYTLKIVCGKSGVKLYLDGKLEAMKGSPGVMPYDGDFLVGHCSGSSDLFGLLHSLRIEQKVR